MQLRKTRREAIAALGGAGVLGLSGCSILGEDGDSTDPASTWPTFQVDARNTGVVDEPGPETEPTEQWRIELAEVPAPIAADGTLFVGGERDDEPAMFAIDAATGDVEWRQPAVGEVDDSAAIAHGNLYVPGDEGLYALDPADGTVRWTWEGEGSNQTAPTPIGDAVYATGAELYEVDPADGSIRSQTDVVGSFDVTPAFGDGVAVTTANDTTVGIDLDSMEVAWRETAPGWSQGPPAVADGRAVVGGDDGWYGLDLATGDVHWEHEVNDRVVASPVVAGDTAFLGDGDGYVTAVDAASGDEQWSLRTRVTVSDLVLAGGTLVAAGGDLVGIDPEGETELWSMDPGGVHRGTAVIDGTIYSADESFAVTDSLAAYA